MYLRFAESLLGEGDYYRAITEYKRAMFFAKDEDGKVHDIALLGVARALFAGQQYGRAGEWLFQNQGEFKSAEEGHEAEGLMVRALLAARRGDRLLEILEEKRASNEVSFYRALAYANRGQWTQAREAFLMVSPASQLAGVAANHAAIADSAQTLNWKSRGLAMFLGIVPGLGYWYSGHKQSGVAALIVNAVFIGATIEAFDSNQDVLGGFLTLFSTSWYASSIYGSGKAAERYNDRMQVKLWKRFEY